MRYFLLVITFLLAVNLSAKKNEQILTSQRTLGKNVDGTEILGTEYLFPERIHEAFLNQDAGLLTLQLRKLKKDGKTFDNGGRIFQYDILNDTLLWTRKISYVNENLRQFDETLIMGFPQKTQRLHPRTGKKMWEIKSNIYFIDEEHNIGVGYDVVNRETANQLLGIDLRRGETKWARRLKRDYAWSDVFHLSDSTLMVCAEGLYSVNIRNGNGWDYKAKTGRNDYKNTAIANGIGIGLGLLTGTFIISYGSEKIGEISSNVLVDGDDIYYASKEQIVKLNKHSGEMEWRQPLLSNHASKSYLFSNDNSVFMVNTGVAYKGGRWVDEGKAYIASFDKYTGTQMLLLALNKRKERILDYEKLGNDLYLVFKNTIAKYSTETGELIVRLSKSIH